MWDSLKRLYSLLFNTSCKLLTRSFKLINVLLFKQNNMIIKVIKLVKLLCGLLFSTIY